MKKVLIIITIVLLANVTKAQWSQVNNGLQNLSGGVRSISGHNGKMDLNYTEAQIMGTIGRKSLRR
jgi:hypothetical protein